MSERLAKIDKKGIVPQSMKYSGTDKDKSQRIIRDKWGIAEMHRGGSWYRCNWRRAVGIQRRSGRKMRGDKIREQKFRTLCVGDCSLDYPPGCHWAS